MAIFKKCLSKFGQCTVTFSNYHVSMSSNLFIFSFSSHLSVWKLVNLSACQFVSFSACKLVSFSACASWSLRACYICLPICILPLFVSLQKLCLCNRMSRRGLAGVRQSFHGWRPELKFFHHSALPGLSYIENSNCPFAPLNEPVKLQCN